MCGALSIITTALVAVSGVDVLWVVVSGGMVGYLGTEKAGGIINSIVRAKVDTMVKR